MSEQPGRYQRSFSGMIGAMVVLLLVVGAYVLLRDANRNDPADPVQPIAYLESAAYAREQADFALVYPRRLPEGWFATSARFVNGSEPSWHLGLLTDERDYVGLEQVDLPVSEMVERFVDEEAERGEDVTIAGQAWEAYSDDQDEALVRKGPDVTTLVVGTVGQDTLVDYVRSLR